jgi:cellulose synthase operon protein YhjQ
MTDREAPTDQNGTPEDVATLYAWANLHGAKYRDFSASRAQAREKARLRMEAAMEEERRRAREEFEAKKAAEARPVAEAVRQAEWAAQQADARQTEIAAQQAPQQQRAWPQLRPDRFFATSAAHPAPPAAAHDPPQPQQFEYPGYALPPAYRPGPSRPWRQPRYAPAGKESVAQPRLPWAGPDPREAGGRPAWLTSDHGDMASRPVPQAPEDTLQGSRDRMTSRWFALRGVFEGAAASVEAAPAPVASRAPVLAIFSLAGGVGKTSLVATLGRALAARGERVLLVDTAAFGLLPFFFGARDQRPGMLRTFSPPGVSGDAPVQMVTIDPESLGPETASQEPLTAEIAKFSREASRVIVDLATASGAATRRVMRISPVILVPVIPDMNSVVSVSSIDAFFKRHGGGPGKPPPTYYVLNQFDPSLPLHLDIREVLREQLGEWLLPFALRRAPAVSEALAEGMTVIDYAPNSPVAEDFGSLAAWAKSLSAPAGSSYRGVRWRER